MVVFLIAINKKINTIIIMSDSTELLLRENKDRFVILPINYPKVWEMYKKHEPVFDGRGNRFK
jgi:ribonucleoside-diphosphate reductase beta chain